MLIVERFLSELMVQDIRRSPLLSLPSPPPLLCAIIMPEFLKTGSAKIRTPSTTWQLKTEFVQRPIKKPISDAGPPVGKWSLEAFPRVEV